MNANHRVSQRRSAACNLEGKVLSDPVSAAIEHPQPNIPAMSLLDLILNTLEDNKAEEIVSIDLAGKSSIADHMVVASGRSSRQVAALADKLGQRMKEAMGLMPAIEGKDQGDWVLLDAGDVIIHLFRPEVREFYQLEKMWAGPQPTDA